MKQKYVVLAITILTLTFSLTYSSQSAYTIFFNQGSFCKKEMYIFHTNRIGGLTAYIFKKRPFFNPSYRIRKTRLDSQSASDFTETKLPQHLFEEVLFSTRNTTAIEFYRTTIEH